MRQEPASHHHPATAGRARGPRYLLAVPVALVAVAFGLTRPAPDTRASGTAAGGGLAVEKVNLSSLTTADDAGQRAGQWSDKGDRRIYPEPPLPPLPAAGGKVIDRTFGTEIMRVTDERDGKLNGNFYPHWPTFNADSTRLLVRRHEAGDAVYEFDPERFRLGRSRALPRLPDNGVLITEGAIWSRRDPDTLYGGTFNGPYLWALDASKQSYKLVKDFSREPGFKRGDYIWQMSMSADDDVFAFTHKDASYRKVGYVVWRRSTDEMLVNVKSDVEDEVRIDKSGRYLVLYLSKLSPQGHDCYVVDLKTGRREGLTPDAPDYSPGHGDVGTGVLVAWDNNDNRFLRRPLADPHRFTTVLEMGRDWMNQHLSMLARDESWALVSFFSYRGGGLGPGLFHDELVLVKTDGSGRVRRLLHHRSKAQDYSAQPRANLSYDGRFAAFSSNWGGKDRADLFVARIDPPLGTEPPAQPAPPGGGGARPRPRRVKTN